MTDYDQFNRQIDAYRTAAKKKHHCSDGMLAMHVKTSTSSLRNRSSTQTLPDLPVWKVVQLVRFGGGDVEIKF